MGCEPASAASVAGLRRLVAERTILPHQQVVAILTGHMLKDPEILIRDSRAVEIEPRVAELERLLRREE